MKQRFMMVEAERNQLKLTLTQSNEQIENRFLSLQQQLHANQKNQETLASKFHSSLEEIERLNEQINYYESFKKQAESRTSQLKDKCAEAESKTESLEKAVYELVQAGKQEEKKRQQCEQELKSVHQLQRDLREQKNKLEQQLSSEKSRCQQMWELKSELEEKYNQAVD